MVVLGAHFVDDAAGPWAPFIDGGSRCSSMVLGAGSLMVVVGHYDQQFTLAQSLSLFFDGGSGISSSFVDDGAGC